MLAAPAERASRLGVAREVSVTTVLPPPLAHRCVSTTQHDQESEVTRPRCLRGPSAAGRPMEAGQSACNVAVRLCPARSSARSRVRTSPRLPPASFGMPAYPAWNRSSSLTGRLISFSSDDEIEQVCRYPRRRTGSSIPASEKISCSGTPCRPPGSGGRDASGQDPLLQECASRCDACSETQDR